VVPIGKEKDTFVKAERGGAMAVVPKKGSCIQLGGHTGVEFVAEGLLIETSWQTST
jgi:hypothetical protein